MKDHLNLRNPLTIIQIDSELALVEMGVRIVSLVLVIQDLLPEPSLSISTLLLFKDEDIYGKIQELRDRSAELNQEIDEIRARSNDQKGVENVREQLSMVETQLLQQSRERLRRR